MTKEQFLEVYPELMQQLKSSAVLQELPDMQRWIEKIVDYNVQGGKMNRGLAVLECYISLKHNKKKKSDDDGDLKVVMALGWALEMIQAFFLVADDIMDDSHTRRMKPCWFRTNNLGVKAFNDAILLESAVYQIISSYCRDRPYYLPVMELFHDVTMKTSLGQAMDLQSAPGLGERPDLNKFTSNLYDSIVKYKTAYYSFYLPVAIAMQMVGIEDKALYKQAEDILLPMGHFFQVQDDYLDCFGDPAVTGKIGTDIEEGKCTWLVVTSLSICNSAQRLIINEHYGSKEIERVNRIKNLYITDLDLPKLYSAYEEESYEQLCAAIRTVDSQLPASFFQGFIEKIYKRSH